jgi:HEAT repeat protein
MMTNSSQQIRIVTLWALGAIRGETNVVLFQRELESAIQRLPSDSPPLGAVNNPSTCVMLLADILSQFGEEAGSTLPVLRPLVLDKNIRVALSAARAAWKTGRETNEVFSVCERAIARTDPNLRFVGAELLSEVCAGARIPLPGEAKLLAAPDPFVRFYAARAVFKLTGDTQRTLPLIVEGLEDHFSYYYRNRDTRRLAAETLAEMGTNARPAIPSVMRALQDGEVSVRRAATNALRRIDQTNGFR